MKIAVLVKEVPDTYGERRLDLETGLTDRAGAEGVPDEIGERAVEAALAYRDSAAAGDVQIVAIAMGPATATATLQKAMAMGADSAVHVCDPDMVGADLSLTAEVLAAAIGKLAAVDLVVAGDVSTDGSAGMVPAMVAERLGWPAATSLASWTVTGAAVSGVRVSDHGRAVIEASLPAVVSVTEAFPEGRLPNFTGIMMAKKKTIEVWSLADLGVDAAPVPPRSIMIQVAERPPRGAGVTISDSGDAAERLADFLVQNRLV